ncbi:MAG: serine/threonine protein kinase [Propionibacteriaceae bacterium]|jgi:serine/threonine protein kinase|nr:serine/threonine protein kinase [Propionibacteriaceae bacterium]
MSPAKRASVPPVIPGYEPQNLPGKDHNLIGQGGFADVFLYRQSNTRRNVAIKVLLAEAVDQGAAQRLHDEASVMAGLSQHPNIVTVFTSETARDGRPCLVMEYYPRPSLAEGLRGARHSVIDVLAIGVQLAGAVESAHRVPILHRDIKPANILVDRSGRPMLGDFGIAMEVAQASQQAEGLSVPFSPPEAFADPPKAYPQSDVWGLAATLYALLSGRPPFASPGDNRDYAMADRICHAPYRPLGRPDAPAALDQVLATAMAKDPAHRYPTMRAFGIALNGVEDEMGTATTRMDIIDDNPDDDEDEDEDEEGTRLRPITSIDPEGPAGRPPTAPGPLIGWPSLRAAPSTGWHSASGPSTYGASTSGLSGPSAPSAHSASGPSLPGWAASGPTLAPGAPPPFDAGSQTVLRQAVLGVTRQRPTAPESPPVPDEPVEEPEPARPRAWWKVWLPLAVAALIGVVIWLIVWSSGPRTPEAIDGPGQATSSAPGEVDNPLGPAAPPAPADLVCLKQDQVAHCSWTNLDPQPGDVYRWMVTNDPAAVSNRVAEAAADVPIPEGQLTVCVEVVVVRSNGVGSLAANTCARAS